MEKYSVEIKGTRPLLMNNPETEIGNVPTKRKGEHLSPEKEAEMKLYRDKEGKIAVPSLQLRGALRCAARGYAIKGRGRATYGSLIRAGIDIEPYMIPLKNDGWKIDIKQVVVQRARIPRARPRFDNWGLEFKLINKDSAILLRDTVRTILIDAGKWCGIGDYRPDFGLFEVIKFEVEGEK
jgi:hypothetical protein